MLERVSQRELVEPHFKKLSHRIEFIAVSRVEANGTLSEGVAI